MDISHKIVTDVKHHTFVDGRVGYTSYGITKESQIVRVINETILHIYNKTKVSVKIYLFIYVVILLYTY